MVTVTYAVKPFADDDGRVNAMLLKPFCRRSVALVGNI
jgi:hypothetical protein